MGIFFSYSREKQRDSCRKRHVVDGCGEDVPVRKRIRSTYDYVYRELFCKGEGSDLTVNALNQKWQLHRLYVKQSPFFAAMLEGGWKESGCNEIELELSDPNITNASLNTVFGSFYRDTVLLSETTVLSVLAAATWFHLEDIRILCSEFMERRLCFRNVVEFNQIAKQYNLSSLSRSTIKWMAENVLLLDECKASYDFLRKIPVELMRETIEQPDLVVVQLEQDVFLLLLKWVYLQNHPDYEFRPDVRLLEDGYAFFTSKSSTYLETAEGAVYAPAFRAIRWEYVLNVYKTTERMIRDRIVPEAWISHVFCRQWMRVLHTHDLLTGYLRSSPSGGNIHNGSPNDSPSSHSRIRTTLTSREVTSQLAASQDSSPVHNASDVGEPGPPGDLPETVFWATSERCGRRMNSADVTCSWRWTGYHFGFDLVVKYKRRTFSVIRFTDNQSAEGSVSHAPRLRLLIALRVKSILSNPVESDVQPADLDTLVDVVDGTGSVNGNGNNNSSISISTPGVLSLSLEENVLHEVLRLPDHFLFPAVVSANLLRYDPIGWNSYVDETSSLTDINQYS
ncbi:Germ cell less protein 1 [Paragonimus heterotremus]|uniref:Germ cell less protein 1 n=1 Tax=Paragonimus heterotremus TaxID=100268 RepID=A0A8J4WIG1_9TREM|nr:Germ cell less protein 1 [Paragonimus heterotremus]